MTRGSRFWFAAFVVVVFAIGGLTGIVADRAWWRTRGDFMGPGSGPGLGRVFGPAGQSPDRLVAELDVELTLSAEQEAAIRKILDEWRPRLQELQGTARQQFVDAQQALQNAIAATLTPEQADRFRERIASRPGGRGPGMGGPGMGGGPGRGNGRGPGRRGGGGL